MKVILSFLLVYVSVFATEVVKVDKKFQKSQKCKACHLPIVKEWEQSWHAKSHYKNDEYFKATIDYVKRKTRRSLDSIKVECATCHNPRISVTSTDINYDIADAMGLNKNSSVKKALKSDAISEGINCIVCHNIDKIHNDKDDSIRGINRVSWMPSGIMTGPFSNTKSPYHNVESRDFMSKKSDELCLVCHANDKSVNGLVFTNMQSEYKKNKKQCVDCHMGEKRKGVASTLKIFNGKAKQRDIRTHAFIGGHSSFIIKDSLSLDLKEKNGKVFISIINPQPHNIPSGFGSREIIIKIKFKRGNSIVERKVISLTRYYTRKRGKPTIAHLALKASKDMSVPANGKKVFSVDNLNGASVVKVELYYRLVNNEIIKLLNLKDPIWSKESFITSKEIKLY